MIENPKCNNSGICCHMVQNGKFIKPCPYLIKLPNGLTKCKVYLRNRIGRIIGKDDKGNVIKCFKREDVHRNYKGCEYNREEWGKELNVGDEISGN